MLPTIIIASLIGSVVAMAGGVLLLSFEHRVRKVSLLFVSFAVGGLLGATFFELIPEAIEVADSSIVFLFLLLGILAMFVFEKLLKWYHCHDQAICDIHSFSSTVLLGDAIHNFLDGLVIAVSFSLSPATGVAATIAIFFHEVPQEIGDFGVLLHAGYKRSRIIALNLLTAVTTPIGAILGYLFLPQISGGIAPLIGFAAGTFIYIAISDLLPELRHKTRGSDFGHFLFILIGIAIIWIAGNIFEH